MDQVLAQAKALQAAIIIKKFQDPQISDSFKKFSAAVSHYENSIRTVDFLETDKSGTNVNSLLSDTKNKLDQVIDLATNTWNPKNKNRFKEHELAAEKLLFAGIELNKKIKN